MTIHSIRMTNFDEVIVITCVISLLHKLQNHIDGERVKPKTIKLVCSASPLGVFVDRIYPSSIIFFITDRARSASYIDLHLENHNADRLRKKNYD